MLHSIAILALLFNALAPSVSWALASVSRSPSEWTEVCSGSGSRWIKLDDRGRLLAETSQRPVDAPASVHGGACSYCLVHAGSFGLPPGAISITLPSALLGEDRALTEAESAPLARQAWATPAVRAPPLPSIC